MKRQILWLAAAILINIINIRKSCQTIPILTGRIAATSK